MKFLAKATDVTKVEADLVAVFAWQGKGKGEIVLSEAAKKVDQSLGGELSEILAAESFEATQGSLLLVTTHGTIGSRRVGLVGVGDIKKLTMGDWLSIAATVGRKAKSTKATRVAIQIPNELLDVFGASQTTQGVVEGVTLGTYTFTKHKNAEAQKKEKAIDEVHLLVGANKLSAVNEGIKPGEIVSGAVAFVRDLINEPPSTTTPTYLAEVAKNLVKGHKELSCEVLGPGEMKKLGMGGLLGIARGSDEEPRFIKLAYRGGGRKTIALVGKGITFDSGGLSLKPSEGMETMKLDMSGAAAVLGVFSVLSTLKPAVNVVGLLSVTENMPGPKAVKPGDVVRAMNGKTIEVLNTDAEGRVVLADALSYAVEKVKPDVIIDLATLTGACVVALGEDIAGLFVNNEKLGDDLKKVAAATGERLWELPLAPEYKELLKSPVADIKNISGKRYGGAINGALFLQEFVPDSIPWAHLDIAGPAFAEKDTPLTPRGGTGFGVRLLLHYLLSL